MHIDAIKTGYELLEYITWENSQSALCSIQQESNGGYALVGYTTSTDGDSTGHHGPAWAATGKWNLMVKNPDGQNAMKIDAFTVTLLTYKPLRISSVTPRIVTGGNTAFVNGIPGNYFNASAMVSIKGPGNTVIPVSNTTIISQTRITFNANLTAMGKRYTTLMVTNPDGKKRR